MKRLMFVFCLAALAIISYTYGVCYAGSLGPIEPLGALKPAISVEYNGVYDRDLEESGTMTGGEINASSQFYVQGALGLADWANIYARLGTANLEQKINWNNGRNQTIKYDYGLLWGVGGNALHNLGNNFGIGGDMQFNMWFTDADSISGTNSPTFTDKGSLKNYEFQTAAYFTYIYEMGAASKIVPYLGGYYSYFKANIDKSIVFQDNDTQYTADDSKGDDLFGLLVGTDVSFNENMSFKLEGRFIAETAFTAGMTYKY